MHKKKKKVVNKTKKDKKHKVTMIKLANGNMKEDEALMDNAGYEDTEMTEIKVEVPQILEVSEDIEVGSLLKIIIAGAHSILELHRYTSILN